jgi:hypothetical protein
MNASSASCTLAVAAVLLAALPLSCRKQPRAGAERPRPLPALGTVTMQPIPALEFRGQSLDLDATTFAQKVRTTLVDSGIFAAAGGARATVAVALEAQLFTAGSADALEIGVRLRLRVTAKPEGAAEARFLEDTVAVAQAPLVTRDAKEAKAALARLVERSAGDLLSSYVTRQKLWTSGSKEVAAALGASDSELRVESLRVVGARKLRDLLPVVLRLISDEDESVRDAALGAVVALGERSAIKPLTESRQMRDLREMRKVLDAVASLGGSEARDYLSFVADNHDDEEIRLMAKAALERMTRRAK